MHFSRFSRLAEVLRHLSPLRNGLAVDRHDAVSDLEARVLRGVVFHQCPDLRVVHVQNAMPVQKRCRQKQRQDAIAERTVQQNEKTLPGGLFVEPHAGKHEFIVALFLARAEQSTQIMNTPPSLRSM